MPRRTAPRRVGAAGALVALAAAAAAAFAAAQQCPFTYSLTGGPVPGGLLLGGVLNGGVRCHTAAGAECPRPASAEKGGFWAEECQFLPSSRSFATANETQRALGLALAEQLYGGEATRLGPCDLFSYIRGRTLWLIGDSHTKQLFKSLTCFMYDFWDGRDCKVSPDDYLVKQLDTLPMMPGESKCLHLLGETRICRVGSVLGSSLLNNPALPEHGVLSFLRKQGLADPKDIFVLQFGLWHLLKGPPGLDEFKQAVQRLGEDYERNRGQWPHLIFRDTPMRHDKDGVHKQCLPAAKGWAFDAATGALSPAANARSDSLLVRGGVLNAPAHEILARYGVPTMGGFNFTVPLHAAHPGTRNTGGEVDCIHYSHPGVPELIVYELARALKAGAGGVQPLQLDAAADARRRECAVATNIA